MIFVFGGSYQGKLDFIKKKFEILEEDIYFCSDENTCLDISKKAIYGLEKFILAAIREKKSEEEIFLKLCEIIEADKILVCCDISQGIVPMDKEQRAWREAVGRIMVKCTESGEAVYRIFCGLATRLK